MPWVRDGPPLPLPLRLVSDRLGSLPLLPLLFRSLCRTKLFPGLPELLDGFHDMRGIPHRRASAHQHGDTERFHYLPFCDALLHRVMGMERNAAVAACGHADSQSDQRLRLGIERPLTDTGLVQRRETPSSSPAALAQFSQVLLCV